MMGKTSFTEVQVVPFNDTFIIFPVEANVVQQNRLCWKVDCIVTVNRSSCWSTIAGKRVVTVHRDIKIDSHTGQSVWIIPIGNNNRTKNGRNVLFVLFTCCVSLLVLHAFHYKMLDDKDSGVSLTFCISLSAHRSVCQIMFASFKPEKLKSNKMMLTTISLFPFSMWTRREKATPWYNRDSLYPEKAIWEQ